LSPFLRRRFADTARDSSDTTVSCELSWLSVEGKARVVWVSASLFGGSGGLVPSEARVWGGGGRTGSDDRVVSGLRVGEGVGEGGGDGATEGCGLTLNSSGIAGRANLRGVRGGAVDGLGRGDGLGITSSTAAATESHHGGEG
jgi:hypothetical protein